jgi:hypothetical protein
MGPLPRIHHRLHPLELVQHLLQREPKDDNIGPVTARKRPHHPHNVSCKDADANFISDTIAIEFVRFESLCLGLTSLSLSCDLAVRAVDGHQTVISSVTFLSVLPNNLRKCIDKRQRYEFAKRVRCRISACTNLPRRSAGMISS